MADFDHSSEQAAHGWLARLCGAWAGSVKTWFQPGVLSDESPIRGDIRSLLGGRFILHEYTAALHGEPVSGAAIYGFDIARGCWVAAWVDSFHNGTALMYSQAPAEHAGGAGPLMVRGSYADPGGGPDWGWNTKLELPAADHLIITHYNVTPAGEEMKAVEIDYRR